MVNDEGTRGRGGEGRGEDGRGWERMGEDTERRVCKREWVMGVA